jgi:hypothetical protein
MNRREGIAVGLSALVFGPTRMQTLYRALCAGNDRARLLQADLTYVQFS